jgi:hypothetical protein
MIAKITWVVVFAAIALLAAFGSDRREATVVSLRNESDATLADVRIALAGKEIWNGTMAPGEKRYARGRPNNEGKVRISFETANGQHVRTDFGRTSAEVGDEYDFVVTSDLEIRAVPPP